MINEIHDTQQLTPKAKENLLRNITPRVIDFRNVRPDKTCECLHNSWDLGINTVETMDDPPSHCRKSECGWSVPARNKKIILEESKKHRYDNKLELALDVGVAIDRFVSLPCWYIFLSTMSGSTTFSHITLPCLHKE